MDAPGAGAMTEGIVDLPPQTFRWMLSSILIVSALLRAVEQRENDHEWEEKRNEIAVRITKTPATDLEGLKAKTLVAVEERPELWRQTVRDLDWHLQVIRSLIEAACVVTGLPVPQEQVEPGYVMPEVQFMGK